MQSVPITTTEAYLIQLYVMKFVSDLRQVSGFLRVLWFPPTTKTEILLKVVLNTITITTEGHIEYAYILYRDIQKVFGHCNFILQYIHLYFHKTTFFSKHYSKVNSCSILIKNIYQQRQNQM